MTYSTATMQRARDLAADEWPIHRIARILEREIGRRPSSDTIRRWVDDNYRLRKNAQVARSQRTTASTTASFRLPSSAPEYQAAFVQRLRDEDVTWENVIRVCRIVFGGRWDRRRVQRLAEGLAT